MKSSEDADVHGKNKWWSRSSSGLEGVERRCRDKNQRGEITQETACVCVFVYISVSGCVH